MESKKVGRKAIHITEEDRKEAKKNYNLKHYNKKLQTLKELKDYKEMMKIKNYSDEEVKKIIELVGFERLLKLMIE